MWALSECIKWAQTDLRTIRIKTHRFKEKRHTYFAQSCLPLSQFCPSSCHCFQKPRVFLAQTWLRWGFTAQLPQQTSHKALRGLPKPQGSLSASTQTSSHSAGCSHLLRGPVRIWAQTWTELSRAHLLVREPPVFFLGEVFPYTDITKALREGL